MGGLPALVNDLKNSIADSLLEVQGAAKELGSANPGDIRTKCQAKKHVTPQACYKECGAEIKVTPELKKKWEAKRKSKAPKKGAKGGKPAKK